MSVKITESPPREGGYRVALPSFEGPLDLLLHLVQQHELDILDIPIGFVTEKYLEYLSLLTDLSIDVASEYLVMAATLAHIKSKMLLPEEPKGQDDEELEDEGDPREELIRRLLEYQKYKQAAASLGDRGLVGRDVFLRGTPAPEAEGPAPLAAVPLFSLLDAFAKVLARTEVSIDHEVTVERFSITERIQQLSDLLRTRTRMRFEELFEEGSSRLDLVVTFLALLEMTRLKMTRVYQSEALASIHVELTGDEAAGPIDESAATGSPPVAPEEQAE